MKTPSDDDPFPQPGASPIFDLLCGIPDNVLTDIHSRSRYLNEKEEREGRKALAAFLRTRKRPGPWRDLSTIEKREAMFNEVCHRLADLIETDPGDESNRRIVFTNPRGQPLQSSTYPKNLEIFHSIEMLLKEDERLSVTEAIEKVAEKHKRSTRWVWDIWRDFRTEE